MYIFSSLTSASSIENNLDESTVINRLKNVSVEQVSDAFDSLGIKNQVINSGVSHIMPIDDKQIICGKAYNVLFSDINDRHPAIGKHTRSYLDRVPPNSVVMIANTAGNNFSVWGGLLSYYSTKHGILGVVTNGSVRDVNYIKKISYFPVFSTGATCNRGDGRYKVVELQKSITIAGVKINPGDYVLGSSSGIVIIDPKRIDEVLELSEKNHDHEKRIIALMSQGYSLSKIDKIMNV